MTVIGAANIMASGGRQSILGLEVIRASNNPNQGAIRNQLTTSGTNVVSIRGRKDNPVSPCDAKPMTVMSAKVMMSPRTRENCIDILRF